MMRWRFRGFIWLLLISVMPSFAADRRLVTSHVPAAMAHGHFTQLGPLPATNQMALALCLPLRNPMELTNLLASIYNPTRPEYRHFLKPKEFTARFGPTAEDYAAVVTFARTNGLTVTAMHSNRLVVDVRGAVANVEQAFQVKLVSFRHPAEKRAFFAPDREPSVDPRVPLLQVSGLDDFSRPHPNLAYRPAAVDSLAHPSGGSSPYGTFMGNDFRQAYVPGSPLTGSGQSVGLLQFDACNLDDITNYASAIGLTNVPPITIVPVDGGVSTPGPGAFEVALDIEMVLAMAPGVTNIYVYEAPNGSPWVDILGQMANDDLSAQLSSSWSGGGLNPAAEQIFQQMAAQGQSFFNASGDSGVYTNLVDFPCASPNITEVGGTYLVTDTDGNYLVEAVWNSGSGQASSGGFAPLVNLPSWQQGLDMSTNQGSTVWRNLPDVALTADEVFVIFDNQDWTGTGTSCAAPLWAAFTALANQQAAQLGQAPVGFLNPALYALCQGTNYTLMFHDITLGNNTNAIDQTNYYATPGYDLCTGWGTPAGTNLINALMTPDTLAIVSSGFFATSSLAGSPFPSTSWTLTLTNTGPSSLDWALGGATNWLTVSAAGGTLPTGGDANISLQLVNGDTLAAGNYCAVLSATNLALSTVRNVVVQVEVRESLVDNGGFETGTFSGWTLIGDTAIGQVVYNTVGTDWNIDGLVHSGNYGAFLGENSYAATLSQSLPTTPGQQYLVSWWLDNLQSGPTQLFNANWDGTLYLGMTNPAAFTWSNFQFVVTAANTNSTLEFAAENDVNFFGLDDVSVLPVPPAVFTNCVVSTNGFQFTWPSLAGLNYLVQYTTDLTEGNWVDLEIVPGWTNFTTYTESNLDNGDDQRFYRLQLAP